MYQQIINDVRMINVVKTTESGLQVSKEAEETISFLLEIKTLIKVIEDDLKEKFKESMEKNKKLKRYEGEKVSVGLSTRSTKQIVGDVDDKFCKKEQRLDPLVVNQYIKEKGCLPDGIEETIGVYINFKKI